jgi:hypothetical protein
VLSFAVGAVEAWWSFAGWGEEAADRAASIILERCDLRREAFDGVAAERRIFFANGCSGLGSG